MTDAAPRRAEEALGVADVDYYVADRITLEIPRDVTAGDADGRFRDG